MIKKFDIWDENINIEDWKEFIEEEEEKRGVKLTENEAYRLIYEYHHEIEFYDTYCDFDIQLDEDIIVIADLGLWDGRHTGYKVINSGNLKDILTCFENREYAKWYCDGYNIRCIAPHHDGTNYLLFRQARPGKNIEEFLNSIYSLDPISNQKLNYYTKSIAPIVGKIYGFCS